MRNVTQYRTVGPNVAEQETSALPAIGMKAIEITNNIYKQNAEAKIVENMSAAQLELNALTNQFQIDNEANPAVKTIDYESNRKKIFDTYGKDIPASYRHVWEAKARDMYTKNDLANQTWALKQSQVNTKNSIKKSMENNMKQAYIDGQNFANSDGSVIDAMANFAVSKQNLLDFGAKHLGPETTAQIIDSYETDSIKSFVAGVLEDDPVKALVILDDENMKKRLDAKDYDVLKNAAENRSLKLDTIREQKKVINAIKAPNSLLAEAQNRQLSIIEIETAARQYNLSDGAKQALLRSAGYSKADVTGSGKGDSSGSEKPRKMTNEEKLDTKLDIYSQLSRLSKDENVTLEKIKELQEVIYGALNAGSVTGVQATQMLDELVTPYLAKREGEIEKLQVGNWNPFITNSGFSQIEEYFDKHIRIDYNDKITRYQNKENRVKLLDTYYSSVEEEAKKAGIKIGDIDDLPDGKKVKLYGNAYNSAIEAYNISKDARLSRLKELPNQVLSNWKLIPLTAGTANIKPDFDAGQKFKTFRDKNGNIARVYPDGTREEIDAMPDDPVKGSEGIVINE